MDSVQQQPLHEQNTGESTSHAPLQKVSQQFPEVFGIPMADRDRIRKELKKYFEEDDLLVPAAQEIIDGGKDIEEVARNYGFEPSLKLSLKLKTNIVQEKKRYWEIKDKIEEAVKHAFFFDEDIKFVAIQRGLDPTVLTYEFNKCRTVKDFTKYNVEKLSANTDGDFTYMEERSLMDELRNVLRISFLVDQWQICRCKICIFECFRNLLFQFAKDQNKQCYSEWSKNENSYFKWLFQFMIGYTKEISELKFSHFCNEDIDR